MTPSMPIATDNIYKFAAIFGLALIISVIVLTVYLPDKYAELAFNNELELKILKAKEHLSLEETIKRNMLEEKDKQMTGYLKTIIWGGAVFAWIGIFLVLWGGLIWWWRIQPKQDELLNLQIEKTKREIAVLNKQLEKKDSERWKITGSPRKFRHLNSYHRHRLKNLVAIA